MAAVQNGEVARNDVAAVLERDSLIADARLLGDKRRTIGRVAEASGEAFAPDEARAGDAEVVNVLAPQQRIVPMVMAVVLIGVPCGVRFSRVVYTAVVAGFLTGQGRIGGEDGASL